MEKNKNISSHEERPLITFALLAYNQEQFVEEAVQGALSQTYSPLEIILSDDCSTDQTYAIMSDMARAYIGPHKVCCRKNSSNLGIASHYNSVVGLATGELIVQAAGDDISMPDRVKETYLCFASDPEVYCVSTDMDIIDERGLFLRRQVVSKEIRSSDLHDFIDHARCELKWFIHNSSFAYRKMLFSQFGPICDKSGETYPIVFRCMLTNKTIAYLEEVLVKHRVTHDNVSIIRVNGFGMNAKANISRRRAKLADLHIHNLQQMQHDLRCASSAGLIESTVAGKLDLKQV